MDCQVDGHAETIQLTLRDYETLCMQTVDQDWCTCDTSSFFTDVPSEVMKSEEVKDISTTAEDDKSKIDYKKILFQVMPVLVVILIIVAFVCLMLRKSDRQR